MLARAARPKKRDPRSANVCGGALCGGGGERAGARSVAGCNGEAGTQVGACCASCDAAHSPSVGRHAGAVASSESVAAVASKDAARASSGAATAAGAPGPATTICVANSSTVGCDRASRESARRGATTGVCECVRVRGGLAGTRRGSGGGGRTGGVSMVCTEAVMGLLPRRPGVFSLVSRSFFQSDSDD